MSSRTQTSGAARGWNARYSEGQPGWEIGRPQPALEAVAERGLLRGHVLDVGCGTGEHALLAASHGATAVGIDISEVAIGMARGKAAQRGLSAHFVVGDALNLPLAEDGVDVVVDSGLFHVFPDSHTRRRYAGGFAAAVRDGGALYLSCLDDTEQRAWGAAGVSRNDIEQAFGADWEIESLMASSREIDRPQYDARSTSAWIATLRRRSRR